MDNAFKFAYVFEFLIRIWKRFEQLAYEIIFVSQKQNANKRLLSHFRIQQKKHIVAVGILELSHDNGIINITH